MQIPEDWLGRKIFEGIDEPPLGDKMETYYGIPDHPNVNLKGYYQTPEALAYLSIEKIREWLKIKKEHLDVFSTKKEGYYVAAHLRRGDYLFQAHRNRYCLISRSSYLRCCDKYGIDKSKIVWVQDNKDPRIRNYRSDVSFLKDFLFLMNADVLLRANSTFSFWAGVLGDCKVYSPHVFGKKGLTHVDFLEGNSESILEASNEGLYIKQK